ncbi:MCE family protein [Gordonia polyisoprenivorans]|uniref:MCE family protein n=1 Tax=Gordonia polyisoprenivorans TaxID=84595 RepID=UPI000B99ED6A|nr:MlaD family protein [Gordonia polyisoprenivorans]OZC29209.1 mammalian cell entry protein [Gordonia polyisoprenivorans]
MKTTAVVLKLVAFVAITTLAGAFVAVTAGNLRFGPSTGYSAVFSSATGVENGSEVRIAGVPVGSVTGVHLDGDGHAVVDFDVRTTNTLMDGTRAVIRYKNLIGDRFIELLDGPGEMGQLPAGGTIPETQTTPALDMDQVVNGFRPLLQGLNPDQANRISASLVQVLNGQEAAVSDLVEQMGTLTNSLADRDQVIGEIINNFSNVLQVINARADQFDGLITGLTTLVRDLSADSGRISSSLIQINGLTGALGGIVTDARPALAGSVTGLQQLTGNLQRNTTTLDVILNRLPETYRLTGRASGYGSFVNFFVCGLAIKYGPGARDRTPMFTAPAARCQP